MAAVVVPAVAPLAAVVMVMLLVLALRRVGRGGVGIGRAARVRGRMRLSPLVGSALSKLDRAQLGGAAGHLQQMGPAQRSFARPEPFERTLEVRDDFDGRSLRSVLHGVIMQPFERVEG